MFADPKLWLLATLLAAAPLAAQAPELDVTRATTPIVSGGTDNVGNTRIAYGRDVTYTLANTGTTTLNISAAGATAGINCTVMLTLTAPPTIAASSNAPFVVRVTASLPGAFSFTVTITNDDPNESTYTFTVSGVATASMGSGKESGDGGCSTGESSAWWLLLAALPAIVWLRNKSPERKRRAPKPTPTELG